MLKPDFQELKHRCHNFWFFVKCFGYREGTRLLKREGLQFVFLMMLQSSVVKLLSS